MDRREITSKGRNVGIVMRAMRKKKKRDMEVTYSSLPNFGAFTRTPASAHLLFPTAGTARPITQVGGRPADGPPRQRASGRTGGASPSACFFFLPRIKTAGSHPITPPPPLTPAGNHDDGHCRALAGDRGGCGQQLRAGPRPGLGLPHCPPGQWLHGRCRRSGTPRDGLERAVPGLPALNSQRRTVPGSSLASPSGDVAMTSALTISYSPPSFRRRRRLRRPSPAACRP